MKQRKTHSVFLYLYCIAPLVMSLILIVHACSSVSKEFACSAGDPGSIPGLGRSPGEEMATHSSILAWKISWTEEPGGLQSMGSQRVRHDWATNTTHKITVTIKNIPENLEFLSLSPEFIGKNVDCRAWLTSRWLVYICQKKWVKKLV